MQGKIALEEHFAIPETLMDSAGFVPDSYWPELKERLLDIQDKRLRQMDEQGVEMMILSLNAPAVQGTYQLEHEQFGTFGIFLVPVGRDPQGLRYEALFNRFIA